MAIPILLYHHIATPPPRGTPSRSNYVAPHHFAAQMRLLHRLGIKGLSLENAIPYLLGRKSGRVAVLTFDDGFLSVFDEALPILARYDFSATCYFVTEKIAGCNDWDKPQARRAPLMGEDELRQFVASGHEVGSHSLTHPHLTRLEQDQAQHEISQSKQRLERLAGRPVTSFAYPYGDQNAALKDMVRQVGYKNGVSTIRGRASPNADLFALPRHSIRRNDRLVHFLLKCLFR